MKRACHITFVVLFFALNVSAQDSKHGSVVVHTDPRLSVLLNKKRAVMQASVAKPAAHRSTETHLLASAAPAHKSAMPGTSSVPITSAPVKSGVNQPVAEVVHSKPEATKPATRPPIYIHEKEGRVIYSGKGFRVQIYNGSDREKAIMIKTEFMRHFPGVRTYLTYISPGFRVKVGNYRHRSDALGMYKEAKEMYSPCVIVPDIITINTY